MDGKMLHGAKIEMSVKIAYFAAVIKFAVPFRGNRPEKLVSKYLLR